MTTRTKHSAWALAMALCCNAPPGAAADAPLDEPIKPLPLTLHQDPARAALGRRLFNDARLSANNGVTCASCHDVAGGGGDARAPARGFRGQHKQVNKPVVL